MWIETTRLIFVPYLMGGLAEDSNWCHLRPAASLWTTGGHPPVCFLNLRDAPYTGRPSLSLWTSSCFCATSFLSEIPSCAWAQMPWRDLWRTQQPTPASFSSPWLSCWQPSVASHHSQDLPGVSLPSSWQCAVPWRWISCLSWCGPLSALRSSSVVSLFGVSGGLLWVTFQCHTLCDPYTHILCHSCYKLAYYLLSPLTWGLLAGRVRGTAPAYSKY